MLGRVALLALAAVAAAGGAAAGPPVRAANGSYPLGGGVWVTQAQVDAVTARLRPLGREVIGYNWNAFDRCLPWAAQGRFTEADMDVEYELSTKLHYLAGGGLYLAPDPRGTRMWGSCQIEVRLNASTLVYDAGAVYAEVGARLGIDQAAQLGRLVPFVHFYMPGSTNWFVVHSTEPLHDVRLSPLPMEQGNTTLVLLETERNLDVIAGALAPAAGAAFRAAFAYLKRVFWLMYYQEPLELLRSVAVAPQDPWSAGAGPAAGFDAFVALRHPALVAAVYGQRRYTDGARFLNASQLEPLLVDADLPRLAAALAGDAAAGKYRAAPAASDGPLPGGAFSAPGEWLHNLAFAGKAQNVSGAADPSSPGVYRARFHYPDVKTCAAGPLPCGPAAGATTAELVRNQTAFVVRAAAGHVVHDGPHYDGMFDVVPWLMSPDLPPAVQWAQPLAAQWGSPLDLERPPTLPFVWGSLLSVRPFGALTGPVVRAFVQTAAAECGLTMPAAPADDLALVSISDPGVHPLLVDDTTRVYAQLQRDAILTMYRVIGTEGRAANATDYFSGDNLRWGDLLGALAGTFGASAAPGQALDASQLDMIKGRDWVSLLTSLGGHTWNATLAKPWRP